MLGGFGRTPETEQNRIVISCTDPRNDGAKLFLSDPSLYAQRFQVTLNHSGNPAQENIATREDFKLYPTTLRIQENLSVSLPTPGKPSFPQQGAGALPVVLVLLDVLRKPPPDGKRNQPPGRPGLSLEDISGNGLPTDGSTYRLSKFELSKPAALEPLQMSILPLRNRTQVEPVDHETAGRTGVRYLDRLTLLGKMEKVLGSQQVVNQVDLPGLQAQDLIVAVFYIVKLKLFEIGQLDFISVDLPVVGVPFEYRLLPRLMSLQEEGAQTCHLLGRGFQSPIDFDVLLGFSEEVFGQNRKLRENILSSCVRTREP